MTLATPPRPEAKESAAPESPYVGRWNRHGQCIVVRREHAHLPHVSYTYWDGGGYCGGYFPVLPGQTPESAAQAHPRAGYPHFSCGTPEVLTAEHPSVLAQVSS